MDTTGKVITCKAAVAWEPNKPLVIEEVEVHPPKEYEVRVKIIATAICRSDLSALKGNFKTQQFPNIVGHEASGIVESVGPGVTAFEKGDHVIPCFLPQCNDCRVCRSAEGNACQEMESGRFFVGEASRFRCKGKIISHFGNCSTFTEYTVIPEMNLTKVSKSAPMDRICLLGCGVGTGYGSARKVAKVARGSTCAIWGLGTIGLAAVMGCRNSGASRIIAIDVNPNKKDIAIKMGASEFFNPKDHSRPVDEVLKEITNGGLDYTFECFGSDATIRQAFDSCHPCVGTCTLVGLIVESTTLEISPLQMLKGKKLVGTFYGGLKPKDDLPKLVAEYVDKKIFLDELVTAEITLNEINEGIQSLRDGKAIRVVLKLGNI